MNAAYDSLESTISSLSPKERISLVPKALLTLNQAVRSVKAPPLPVEQNDPDEDTEVETETEAQSNDHAKIMQLLDKITNQDKAHDMLREGKGFDEITAETGVTEDEMKEKMAREKVKHEVLGMYQNGMELEEIQRRTNLDYAYINSIIDNAVNNRIWGYDIRGKENPEFHDKTRSLLKNGDGVDLDADSDAATLSTEHNAEWNPR